MSEMGQSWQDPTSELVNKNMGDIGAKLFAALVAISCLGAMNAMIFTSPRIYSATAEDFPKLSWLVASDDNRGWWRALLLQMLVTLVFIYIFGVNSENEIDKQGIDNIVAATAPYFWLFLALTVVSLVLNRMRYKPDKFPGYRVPFFPLLPVFFTAACVFMVYRGILYMGEQELWIPAFGIAGWMLFGVLLSFLMDNQRTRASNSPEE